MVIILRLIDKGMPPDFHDSYDSIIVLSDLFLFLAGVILGLLIFVLYLPSLFANVYISPKLKENTDLNMISVVNEKGEEFIYLNPRTFTQSVGMIMAFVLWRFTPTKKRRTFHLHADRIALTIFFSIVTVLTIIVLVALYLIFTVQE